MILLLCQFSIQYAFCGSELTREMAKAIMIKDMGDIDSKFPISRETKFDQEVINIHKQMATEGLVYLKTGRDSAGNVYSKVVGLTPKGAQYLIRNENNGDYIVRAGKVRFGEITGILKIQPNIAKVDYTIIIQELTPFASPVDIRSQPIDMVAIYALYDDGWRIEEAKEAPKK